MKLDIRTIYVLGAFIGACLVIYLLAVRRSGGQEYRGIRGYALGMAAISACFGLTALQGLADPFLTVVLSSPLFVLGMGLIHDGLRAFLGFPAGRAVRAFTYSLAALAFAEQLYFTYVEPDLMARMLILTAFFLVPTAQILGFLARRRLARDLPGILLAVGFAVQAILLLGRFPALLANPAPGDFLSSGGYQAAASAVWVVVASSWPISFALLILRRAREGDRARSAEKTVLLQELHHRTKNNMQVISSLLRLQLEGSASPEVREQLAVAERRIQAIAMVHEKLYYAESHSRIPLKDYVEELALAIAECYRAEGREISLECRVEEIEVLYDVAIPVGMVLNELLSNAYAHAFPSGNGAVSLRVFRGAGRAIVIEVRDDGIGLPPGFDPARAGTLGLSTVMGIARGQLGGQVSFECTGGTAFRIEFEDGQYGERV